MNKSQKVLRVVLKTAFASVLVASAQCFFPQAQAQPNVVGEWSGVVNWPVVNIHISLLPNGKLLLWPRDGGVDARIWDPGNSTFTQVPLPSMNLFCAGHSF